MTEDQNENSNPVWWFFVTGVSFSLFALVLDQMNGQHIQLMWWISRISFALGLLTAAYNVTKKISRERKRDPE